MPDDNNPPAGNAEPPPQNPPTDPEPKPSGDNATIRQMREALEQANKRAAEAEGKLKEAEREKLSEIERLRVENEELKPLRDEHGRFASTLEQLYTQLLESVPEDKRAQVEALSATGGWDARLNSARAAISLLPTTAPAPAGTTTNPAQRAKTPDIDALIAEAESKGDAMTAIRLKRQKAGF